MKHALLPLALAALVPAVAQIPNPGFEEWAPVAGGNQRLANILKNLK